MAFPVLLSLVGNAAARFVPSLITSARTFATKTIQSPQTSSVLNRGAGPSLGTNLAAHGGAQTIAAPKASLHLTSSASAAILQSTVPAPQALPTGAAVVGSLAMSVDQAWRGHGASPTSFEVMTPPELAIRAIALPLSEKIKGAAQAGYQSHVNGATLHAGDAPNRSVLWEKEEYRRAPQNSPQHAGAQRPKLPTLEGRSAHQTNASDHLLFKQRELETTQEIDVDARGNRVSVTTPPANAYVDTTPIEVLKNNWYEVKNDPYADRLPADRTDQSKPTINLPLGRKAGHKFASGIYPGGAPHIFEGHGGFYMANGYTTVPTGVRVTTLGWGEKVLTSVADRMASGRAEDWFELAEMARDDVRVAEQIEGMTTWLSGVKVPNYSLSSPGPTRRSSAIAIHENSTTVGHVMPMSKLLAPGMGGLVWVACTAFMDGIPHPAQVELLNSKTK